MTTKLSPEERRRIIHALLRILEQEQPQTRPYDPLERLRQTLDKGLLTLERGVYKLVSKIVR